MKADVAPPAVAPGFFSKALRLYQDQTGQSALVWALMALLNLITQIVLFGEMWGRASTKDSQGEFGIFNAALGIVGLLTVPLLALRLAFSLFFARARDTRLDPLRNASVTITETFAWVWGACCFVLILAPLPLPFLPRFSLQLLTLMNVLLALGATVSWAICEDSRQMQRWSMLLVSAAATRAVLGGLFTAYQPWAEVGQAAFLIAGFIILAPALHPRDIDPFVRLKTCAAALDRDFLLFAGATLSILLGIYLFTNADRIAALRWADAIAGQDFHSSEGTMVQFDTYQATGLVARGLLWGTQPLLWILYAQRAKLVKTTAASLKFFWIYLAVLVIGAFLLGVFSRWPHGLLSIVAQNYGPTFAAIMVPLGLLQGLAIFSLASRRYPECFVIGGCGIVYALVLALFGRRPDMMLPYMFGLSLISLMIVLFVGVVRWGRKQP